MCQTGLNGCNFPLKQLCDSLNGASLCVLYVVGGSFEQQRGPGKVTVLRVPGSYIWHPFGLRRRVPTATHGATDQTTLSSSVTASAWQAKWKPFGEPQHLHFIHCCVTIQKVSFPDARLEEPAPHWIMNKALFQCSASLRSTVVAVNSTVLFFFFLKKLRMIVVTNPLRMTYKPSASHWCRTSHFACSTSQTTLSENNGNTVLFYIPIWLTLFYLTYFYQHLFFLSQQLSYLTGRWLLSQHCCFFFFFLSERSVSVSVLGSNPLSCFYEHHWNWIRTQDFLNPELVGYL